MHEDYWGDQLQYIKVLKVVWFLITCKLNFWKPSEMSELKGDDHGILVCHKHKQIFIFECELCYSLSICKDEEHHSPEAIEDQESLYATLNYNVFTKILESYKHRCYVFMCTIL